MDIMRLNFSHGQYEEQGARVANLAALLDSRRAASPSAASYHPSWPCGSPPPVAVTDALCAVAIDTKGPEIRTGHIKGGAKLDLASGSPFELRSGSAHREAGDASGVWVDYPLEAALLPGDLVYIDDGQICLRAESASPGVLRCTVVHGGRLGDKKGINVPGRPVDLPAFTAYDQAVLAWGVSRGVDLVFASFTRSAEDVTAMRAFLASCGPGGDRVQVIAKIESTQGVANFDEILAAADGIMVARGDLAIEIPLEDVPVVQKSLIARCNAAGKPVIVATQMMESMEKRPRPTRAEAADVANAVLDGADGVMTSGETTNGDHPELVVATMARIAARAELALVTGELAPSASADHHAVAYAPGSRRAQLALAAATAAAAPEVEEEDDDDDEEEEEEVEWGGAGQQQRRQQRQKSRLQQPPLLVVPAVTGSFAAEVGRHRGPARLLAPTFDPRVANRLLLRSGLQPLLVTRPGGEAYSAGEVAALLEAHGKPAVEEALARLAVAYAGERGWTIGHSSAVAAVASGCGDAPSILLLPVGAAAAAGGGARGPAGSAGGKPVRRR